MTSTVATNDVATEQAVTAFRGLSDRTDPGTRWLTEITAPLRAGYDGGGSDAH